MKDEEFLKHLGQGIKKMRKAKALSQVDVCSKLNMDKTYLSAIENGRQNPSVLTLKQILEAMGEDAWDLMGF